MNDRFAKALAAAGLLLGTGAAVFYHRQGLTLSHYDAKAHLVVARRVLDSLTPEYSQIGAVWLPLPHLLNLLPVQIDAFYRNGASGVAISILAFALACYAIARIVRQATGSRAGAAVAVGFFALEPDVLYLQSTPMTEPLLFGLTLLAVSLVYEWVDSSGLTSMRAAGLTLIAAVLTRYESWPVTAALLALSFVALWRRGLGLLPALWATTRLGVYPMLAILAFFFHSWFTTGDWFVTGGFFVPDNVAYGHAYAAFMSVVYGMRLLVGNPLILVAVAGAATVAVQGLRRPDRSSQLVFLALVGFMALPTYAFYHGHPFRMRYMVAPVVGVAVFVGIAVGALQKARWTGLGRHGPSNLLRHAGAMAAAGWILATLHPFDPKAPMVLEAQWDRPFSEGRRSVTACLMREYQHEPILASMGSLAHYMQELSHEGIGIRDFVHEGNLPYWQEAVESPKGRVGWILVEERAEGGDVLAARTRASSAFLTGFHQVCSGGGVVLYKAD